MKYSNKIIYTILTLVITIIVFFLTSLTLLIIFPDEQVEQVLKTSIYFSIFVLFIISIIGAFLLKNGKKEYQENINLENIPPEFEKIYKELYSSHISELEKERKKLKFSTTVQNLSIILLCISYGCIKFDEVITSEEVRSIIGVIFLISFITAIVFCFKNVGYRKKYVGTYKDEIIGSFVKLVSPNLKYNKVISVELNAKEEYLMANFEDKRFNRFYDDDYISGTIDENVHINMCDLHIQNVTGGGRNRHTEEIFQGLFCKTNCNKNINTVIEITRNKIKFLNNQNRIEMDSSEFEEYFDVYSENKILTMQLLTSDVMETLIDFYKKYNLEFEIVFKNKNIYIRFFTGAMFEPKVFGSSMDKQLLFMYFTILKFVLNVNRVVNKTLNEMEI